MDYCMLTILYNKLAAIFIWLCHTAQPFFFAVSFFFLFLESTNEVCEYGTTCVAILLVGSINSHCMARLSSFPGSLCVSHSYAKVKRSCRPGNEAMVRPYFMVSPVTMHVLVHNIQCTVVYHCLQVKVLLQVLCPRIHYILLRY